MAVNPENFCSEGQDSKTCLYCTLPITPLNSPQHQRICPKGFVPVGISPKIQEVIDEKKQKIR